MNNFLDNFHFLRVEWFWAFIPMAIISFLLFRQKLTQTKNNWGQYVDAHLLSHLGIQKSANETHGKGLALFIATLIISILALAGPSWEKAQTPSSKISEPTVLVLSLAQSMNADDIKPSRLKRSIHKLHDILNRTKGGDRALIIYSDTPFIAAPLTNDAKVINQMLPELSTTLMPVLGNRLDLAIDEATQLLKRTHAHQGKIVLLTDSVGDRPEASIKAANKAHQEGYIVSVLAVGTEKGATLETASGKAITNNAGGHITTKLTKSALEKLAINGGGKLATITADGKDLSKLFQKNELTLSNSNNSVRTNELKTDSWVDMGYWLLLIPLFVGPLLFRQGLIFSIAFIAVGATMEPQYASAANATNSVQSPPSIQQESKTNSTWRNLWETPNQQGTKAFHAKDYTHASQAFESPEWQAASKYRSGDFAGAVKSYSNLPPQQQGYNLGNALAKSGDLEGALKSYDAYIKTHPTDENAKFNRELVSKLLKKQKQNKSDKNKKKGKSGKDQKKSQDGKDQQKPQDSKDQQKPQDGKGQQKQASTAGKNEEKKSNHSLSQLMDNLLSGNKDKKGEKVAAKNKNASAKPKPLDQATEQQLRRIPDDPTGLLRARIRQHYSQLRSTQQ